MEDKLIRNEQEAIEAIKSNYPKNGYYMLREALDIAISALDKQIPKEPIDDKYRHKCCPICGWLVCYDEGWGDKYVPHCENCGQALKWGD